MIIEEIIKNPESTFVDVRTFEEFEEGTVPGAVNIPLHTIPVQMDQIKQLQQPVVVFCRSGARSYQAATWLKQQGITVHDGGGIAQVMSLKTA